MAGRGVRGLLDVNEAALEAQGSPLLFPAPQTQPADALAQLEAAPWLSWWL